MYESEYQNAGPGLTPFNRGSRKVKMVSASFGRYLTILVNGTHNYIQTLKFCMFLEPGSEPNRLDLRSNKTGKVFKEMKE